MASFRKDLKIAPGTMTKMRKNEEVALSILLRICEYLDCNIRDICDAVKIETYVLMREGEGDMSYCSHCGKELLPNARFCQACGSKEWKHGKRPKRLRN